jgi:hypothetical protein
MARKGKSMKIATPYLEKRTSESVWYDIDCTDILNVGETIVSISGVTADTTGLTFGTPVANASTIAFPDGTTGAIGKVIIVQISGGLIPAGKTVGTYIVRALFLTSAGNTREATVQLNVTNLPISRVY